MDAKFILGSVTLVVFVSLVCSQMPPGGFGASRVVPKPRMCREALDCGNSGCCLKGVCSKSGGIFDKCYTNVAENSRERPRGIWNKTDVCPCEYTYYCWRLDAGQTVDRNQPLVGTCMPVMG